MIASVFASLLARQVVGVDLSEVVEALRGASPVTRKRQSLEITLERKGEEVLVLARHRFELYGSAPYVRRVSFSLYTDAGRWGRDGGFSSVREPNGAVLTLEQLDPLVTRSEGKEEFSNIYTVHPRKPSSFEIETFAVFRRTDRLIWTVEHISSDFSVLVFDRRGEGRAHVKINHHRHREIASDISRRCAQVGEVIPFTFLGPVLPFRASNCAGTQENPGRSAVQYLVSLAGGHRGLGDVGRGSSSASRSPTHCRRSWAPGRSVSSPMHRLTSLRAPWCTTRCSSSESTPP
jgi:hypothetical protein